MVGFDLQNASGCVFHFGLVLHLLVGAHGLLQSIQLHNALRILVDKCFHGLGFLGGVLLAKGSHIGIVFSLVFDGLAASVSALR